MLNNKAIYTSNDKGSFVKSYSCLYLSVSVYAVNISTISLLHLAWVDFYSIFT